MYTFDSIAGYKAEKEELIKLCDILKNEEAYVKKGARMPKGLVLYGPTGTGKTLFVKVLAAECGMPIEVIDLTGADGEKSVCRKIKAAFDRAERNERLTMVFMDEIDKLMPNPYENYASDQAKAVLTQLLTLIDGISPIKNVFFVATCNDYEIIPSSLVRPGRIDRKINIDFPNVTSREAVLNMYMDRSGCTFGLSAAEIAALCTGFSCAGLEMLINECIFHSSEEGFVTANTVYGQIEKINNEDVLRDVKGCERRLNAAHQIGHFVVGQVLHGCESSLLRDEDIVCNTYYDAFLSSDSDYDYDEDDEGDARESDEGSTFFLKEDCVDLFAVLCGGKAGEALLYKGATDKCRSDMERLRWLFINMSECGMFGMELLYNRNTENCIPYPQSMYEKLNQEYFRLVTQAEKRAHGILSANKKLCVTLFNMLINQKRLSYGQINAVVTELGGYIVPTLA